jgi:hypothetical protein
MTIIYYLMLMTISWKGYVEDNEMIVGSNPQLNIVVQLTELKVHSMETVIGPTHAAAGHPGC